MRPRRVDARRPRRRGFTLLELIAALTLTGFALLGARGLLDQLADGRDRIRHEGTLDAGRANGEALLRALVAGGRADAGPDSSERLEGDAAKASFDTWCGVPAGWLERCAVTLRLSPAADSSTLDASVNGGSPLRLWSGAGVASLAYLERERGTNGWSAAWRGSIVPPAAIGLVAQGDTLVLPIGAAP